MASRSANQKCQIMNGCIKCAALLPLFLTTSAFAQLGAQTSPQLRPLPPFIECVFPPNRVSDAFVRIFRMDKTNWARFPVDPSVDPMNYVIHRETGKKKTPDARTFQETDWLLSLNTLTLTGNIYAVTEVASKNPGSGPTNERAIEARMVARCSGFDPRGPQFGPP
jgi:hypothetical protein